MDSEPSQAEKQSFRIGISALLLLIAVIVSLQVVGFRVSSSAGDISESDNEAYIRTGDIYAMVSLAWSVDSFVDKSLQSYRKAVPWPSAYRRLGVFKELHGMSGISDFEKLDSSAKKLHLSAIEIKKLHREKAMWLRIFNAKNLTQSEAPKYEQKISLLNLGPLNDVALLEVRRRTDKDSSSAHMLEDIKAQYRLTLIIVMCLCGMLALGGLGGVAIAAVFVRTNASKFADAPRNWFDWPTGVSSFIIYLASYIGFATSVTAVSEIVGNKFGEVWVDASYLALVITSAILAYFLGMWILTSGISRIGMDWREIGYRTTSVGRDVVTGLAGFFAALPLLFVAAIAASLLARTVFKNIPTPQQPIEGIVSSGNALGVVLAFFAASVIAPLVEETFFRGVLYTTLRGRMGVWAAVGISSAMFAVVHPLPNGFLPIFVLGSVFALMRERTGSLLPSIVCHCVYNTIQLIIVLLLF